VPYRRVEGRLHSVLTLYTQSMACSLCVNERTHALLARHTFLKRLGRTILQTSVGKISPLGAVDAVSGRFRRKGRLVVDTLSGLRH